MISNVGIAVDLQRIAVGKVNCHTACRNGSAADLVESNGRKDNCVVVCSSYRIISIARAVKYNVRNRIGTDVDFILVKVSLPD